MIAPERHSDITRLNQDGALLHNWVLGPRRLYELKFQGARRRNESDVSRYCPNCPAENRPGVLLGKSPTALTSTVETRWQVLNAFTWIVPDRLGDHTVKFGVDASVLRERGIEPAGFDGIFSFNTNAPFDPAVAGTYPFRYLRNEGNPETDFGGGVYAGFVQDSWTPTARITVNAGLRWDYQDAPGIAHDRDNVAPRVGLAYGLRDDGSLTIRGSYGLFYDQVILIISSNALRAATVTQGVLDPSEEITPGELASIPEPVPATTRTTAAPTPGTAKILLSSTTNGRWARHARK